MITTSNFLSTFPGALSTLVILAGAAAALLVPTAAQAGEGGKWEEHYDVRLGVSVTCPAEWSVRSEGYTLLVQSADHASLVLAEAFIKSPGETAQAHVTKLAAAHPSLFPGAHIDRIAPHSSAADEVLGALSYRNGQGKSGQVRVLCSVFQQSGMLYALAAPEDRFPAERATLLKILQSLRFGPLQSQPKTSGVAKSGTAAKSPASSHNPPSQAVSGLHFVKWTDPKEHAYTVEVPQGWSVEGGAFRFESSDVRTMNRVISPDMDMFVQVGDQGLPTFLVPTPITRQTYRYPEGVLFSANHTYQNMILRYLPAREFNRRYMDQTLKQGVDDLAVTKEEELPELARQIAADRTKSAASSGAMLKFECNIAVTEFKGRLKTTGKPVIGKIISNTQIVTAANVPGMPQWTAQPIVILYADDEKAEAHQQILRTVSERLNQSFQANPEWEKRQNELVNRETARIAGEANAHVAAIGELSKKMAADTETRRKSIMGSYWNHVDTQNDQQRKFLNHIGDNTDVRNPATGQAYKVPSGYSNYYHDPRSGTIIGTNSTDRPPVDFTTLNEF